MCDAEVAKLRRRKQPRSEVKSFATLVGRARTAAPGIARRAPHLVRRLLRRRGSAFETPAMKTAVSQNGIIAAIEAAVPSIGVRLHDEIPKALQCKAAHYPHSVYLSTG